MPEVVQAKCPGCKQTLRIPADWLNQPVRCKHCGTLLQAKHKPAPAAPASAPPRADKPTAPESSKPRAAPRPRINAPAAVENADAAPVDGDNSWTFAEPSRIVRTPPQLRGSRWKSWTALGITLAVVGGIIFGIVKIVQRQGGVEKVLEVLDSSERDPGAYRKDVIARKVIHKGFPRRLLAISLNNYLYANPVSNRLVEVDNVHGLVRRLAGALHVDPSQVLEISDAPPGEEPKSPEEANASRPAKKKAQLPKPPAAEAPKLILPLKPALETGITRFLETSRPQDRVLLLFVGHVVLIDDAGYLVPIEADTTDTTGLIPLAWLFDKLKACPARQKVLVLDTCRIDPGRGVERPGSGPMPDRLEALLRKAPEGVQVWSACSKGEYSYEVDGVGVFLDKLYAALSDKSLLKQHEDDPLPIEAISDAVAKTTAAEVHSQYKAKQSPVLFGKEPEKGAEYDSSEPLPDRVVLATPVPEAGMARPEEISTILKEVDLPPIKLSRAETAPLAIEKMHQFKETALKDYRPDYSSLAEITEHKDKFPLRAAVLDVVKVLRRDFDPQNEAFLRETFAAGAGEKSKRQIVEYQYKPARILIHLSDALDELRKAGEERKKEPSRRWQAHYDYVLAQLLARTAYVHEYDLMLGKVRKDELPELVPNLHFGWRLASRDKPQSRDVKDLVKESKKLFARIAKDYRGTPWEVLGKRAELTALGLEWQPTR
jgi:hypothetical protein